MESYAELKKMLCKELDEVAKKKELSAGDLEVVDKLTHSLKSLGAIMTMEEEGGYSGDYGYSGARRRDSMGRYADGGYSGRYYDDMSMDGGYSGRRYSDGSYDGGYSGRRYSDSGYSGRRYSRDEGKMYLLHQFEKLMDDASNPEEREVLQSAIIRLKSM